MKELMQGGRSLRVSRPLLLFREDLVLSQLIRPIGQPRGIVYEPSVERFCPVKLFYMLFGDGFRIQITPLSIEISHI